ncbi:hypothetical protein [Streptomyces sp. UNOB3_S3]|uniref:hypothetical protein n=1 Tax=Streptomyces sp. UNOB3_S3 TaxID=2871682 RepID=UPI001E2E50C5|nr:hypothetical protein [Streptomyces sp. UNOB3_S3]MCC3779124.1 hypothetical protein [Streptomyces sp. UNOB3_S3]
MRLLAYMLRSGDVVDDGRDRREVKSVRERGRDVIVVFKGGDPLRVGRDAQVTVQRGWGKPRREAR